MKNYLISFLCLLTLTQCGPSSERINEAEAKSALLADTADTTSSKPLLAKSAEMTFRVDNTQRSARDIEKNVMRCGGFILKSEYHADKIHQRTDALSDDSVLVTSIIRKHCYINCKVPEDHLELFLETLNTEIQFLENRTINAEDLSVQRLQYKLVAARNSKHADRLQDAVINSRCDKTKIELLDRQIATDEKQDEAISGQFEQSTRIQFADVTLHVFQKDEVICSSEIPAEGKLISKVPVTRTLSQNLKNGLALLTSLLLFLASVWPLMLLTTSFLWFVKKQGSSLQKYFSYNKP